MIKIQTDALTVVYREDEANAEARLVRCNDMTVDQIEDLELQLTKIVSELYAYRKGCENAKV